MNEQNRPIVSVIVPVYNVEKYIAGCLASILNQTFTNFEVICVDDGSPDNSISIVAMYANKDKRIRVLRQKNQGLSVSRNNAMDVAKGEYIFFVDSDDYIAPQTLEFLHRAIVQYNADIACARFTYTGDIYSVLAADEKYECIKVTIFDNPLYAYFKERKKIYGMVWNKLYRSELLKDIRFVPGRLFEDEIFTALTLEQCQKIIHMDFNIYYYFGNPQAISKKNIDSKMLDDFVKNAEFLCEHFARHKDIDIIKERKVKALLSMCYKKIKNLDKDERGRLFKELKSKVKCMNNRGLISYSDFNVEGKLKLFRLLYLI